MATAFKITKDGIEGNLTGNEVTVMKSLTVPRDGSKQIDLYRYDDVSKSLREVRDFRRREPFRPVVCKSIPSVNWQRGIAYVIPRGENFRIRKVKGGKSPENIHVSKKLLAFLKTLVTSRDQEKFDWFDSEGNLNIPETFLYEVATFPKGDKLREIDSTGKRAIVSRDFDGEFHLDSQDGTYSGPTQSPFLEFLNGQIIYTGRPTSPEAINVVKEAIELNHNFSRVGHYRFKFFEPTRLHTYDHLWLTYPFKQDKFRYKLTWCAPSLARPVSSRFIDTGNSSICTRKHFPVRVYKVHKRRKSVQPLEKVF